MTPCKLPRSTAVIGMLLLAGALGGCDRRDDDRTTGQKVDAAIAQADDKLDAAKADADKALADAKKATTEAVHAAAAAVNDTTITAAVKSSLSSDAELKPADLSVETRFGRVSLRGMLPDAAARDRASQLAAAVQGVVAVDNQVTVVR
jgi:hyperosmotically inducible periplasmic protein